ncbi:MAG TPA: peptide chain release factor N(5)-glutamine methyltransferase [Polyangiaceae bacterium]|jgi:release factor glutamine methyltransferase|nr:peptide chain release factor N(5)-glutamine methyltransferase [Polyangiaceae bacterium]
MTAPQPPEWTIESVLRWATDDFRARGIERPRLDSELLLGKALGRTRIQLIADAKQLLEPGELGRFRELLKRRRAREPVAYILGVREFYGRPFRVDARVLIPRPDTETLIEVALERTRALSMSARFLDLCTGSGAVAVTLARERPTSLVVATDISPDAVAVARENALRLGAYNVALRASDLFAGLEPAWRFDLVTANPPYIAAGEIDGLQPEIRDHEPRLALAAGIDGLDVVRRIVVEARPRLRPRGVLAVEVGFGQAPAVAALFASAGFVEVEVRRDYGRVERVVSGVLQIP